MIRFFYAHKCTRTLNTLQRYHVIGWWNVKHLHEKQKEGWIDEGGLSQKSDHYWWSLHVTKESHAWIAFSTKGQRARCRWTDCPLVVGMHEISDIPTFLYACCTQSLCTLFFCFLKWIQFKELCIKCVYFVYGKHYPHLQWPRDGAKKTHMLATFYFFKSIDHEKHKII